VNTVNTYDKLLSILKQFDGTLVCQGVSLPNQLNEVNSLYGYQFVESYGMWRHLKCSAILTKDNSKNRLLILNLNGIIFYYLYLTIYNFKISGIFVYGANVCIIKYEVQSCA